jgi:hypothetical protein
LQTIPNLPQSQKVQVRVPDCGPFTRLLAAPAAYKRCADSMMFVKRWVEPRLPSQPEQC